MVSLFRMTSAAHSCAACAHHDPHLSLAHGGLADFRGVNDTMYSFISAPNMSMTIRTQDAVSLGTLLLTFV